MQLAVRALQIHVKPAEQLADPHAAAARFRHFHVGATGTGCCAVGYDHASRHQDAVQAAQAVTYRAVNNHRRCSMLLNVVSQFVAPALGVYCRVEQQRLATRPCATVFARHCMRP